MGELIDGQWHRTTSAKLTADGRLRRPPSVYRNWISYQADTPFKPEAGRYHLYVSLACPWAHRTLIMRSLKGLETLIDISIVNWLMGEEGWTFEPGPGVVPDSVNGATRLHQLYTLGDPRATTRVTVPVLWDKQTRRIVSNESAEIIRMFNSAFDGIGARAGDFYPGELRTEIDALNERIYESLNNGVYKAGFATTQSAYEEAARGVFETLDWLEHRLEGQAFLLGGRMTEADIRLFTTLLRFDPVYHGHFKCNRRMIAGYPALWDYTRMLHQHPLIRPTIAMDHIKGHYYASHPWINPSRIVPLGPDIDYDAPLSGLRASAARAA
ncbi:glutathione S-transferase family protein [Labrys sp. (in: a-proteobacteria)]|uniref:glutathione S-transferase family protein n=1 Tax=Labrys sp. (in: a-proteobacteria) TaxID=1917972 RepID=UPI0039E4FE4F